MVKYPHRYAYFSSIGYVVWRDVFDGNMTCSFDDAVKTHKVAVFVTEEEAKNYCDYRNVHGRQLRMRLQPQPVPACRWA